MSAAPTLDSGPDPRPVPPLWPAGRLVLLAGVVLLTCLGLALHDLANSNRPHELTAAPWVTLLAAANLWVGWRASRALRLRDRAAPERVGQGGPLLLTVALAVIMVADALVLLAAAGSVPAVLGWTDAG